MAKLISVQELAKKRQFYKTHPYEFMVEILGIKVAYHQKKMIEAIVRYNKVTIKSANSIGKSFILSALAVWFFYCYLEGDDKNVIVLFTAPTFGQVRENIYNPILAHIDKANQRLRKLTGVKDITLFGDISKNKNLAEIRYGHKNYIMGVSNDGENKNVGKHGTYVLCIFDEAQQIENSKFTDFVGIGLGGRLIKQVMIGNTTLSDGNTGVFYDSFKPESVWHRMSIPCFDTPNFIDPNIKLEDYTIDEKSPNYWRNKLDRYCGTDYYKALKEDNLAKWEDDVKQKLEWSDHLLTPTACYDVLMQYGGSIDSYEFLTRCRAEFPKDAMGSLFPQSWIEKSISSYGDDSKWQQGEIVLGCDIAQGGSNGDKSAITVRNGNKVIFAMTYNLELLELVDKIEEVFYRFDADKIIVERDGVGKDKILLLQEKDLPVIGVQMGGGAGITDKDYIFDKEENDEIKKSFYRKRDEVWWNLRSAFNPLRDKQPTSKDLLPILIPDIPMLRQELTAMAYSKDGGKVKIISKAELKNKIARSPDLADSVALAFSQSDEDLSALGSFCGISVSNNRTNYRYD